MNNAARLYAESGAQNFSVPFDQFSQWLQTAADPSRLNELVLARACALGNSVAWDRFLSLYREKLYAAALAITRDQTRARELADSLYADLYTRSKFDSYQGRGSLEGWLKTILAQQHINALRREKNLVAFDDSRETPAAPNPALPSNAQALNQAADAALTDLPSEDRFLLASYYLDGRTLAEIARMLHVHESTISRRLEKITATLRKQIVTLMIKAGIPKRAAEEMLEVDVRILEINVREKLAQERQA